MADDDDIFVYDDDGKPIGVKASADRPALNEAELHDVTVVATAANELEAVALIEMLEDAGIPAMKRGGIVHLGSLGPSEIMVPRKLLDAARSAVNKLRGDATERGIDEAFKPESVEDQEIDSHPSTSMAEMLSLGAAGSDNKDRLLSEFIAQATADAMPAPELARHLAAAGLNRSEADARIASVKTDQSQLLISSLNRRATGGYSLAFLGVLLFFAPFFGAVFPFLMVIGACLGVAGLGIAAMAQASISKLEK